MRKAIAILLQLFTMLSDLLIIAALILTALYVNMILAFVLLLWIDITQKEVGGWFYAWRPGVIKKFWKHLTEQDENKDEEAN